MRGPTCDPTEIRQWAEHHGAVPAQASTRAFDSEPAILRFLFGKARTTGTVDIRPIGWDAFLAQFALMNLVLVYDESPNYEILQTDTPSLYRPSL